MEDLIEQANEIQESLGRSYGVPDEVDEADLQAGKLYPSRACDCIGTGQWSLHDPAL